MGSILFLGLIAVILVYFILIYNNLVAIKHNVAKAWANIDVLLKQRHDELPKLVDTCKQYMRFEQETLEKVINARARVADARETHNIAALGAAESVLRAGLGNLFALVESYPELKANEQFVHLQARITGLENAIADRREFYNESVNINNMRIQQFPDLVVARMFNFPAQAMLRFEAGELKDVSIAQQFG